MQPEMIARCGDMASGDRYARRSDRSEEGLAWRALYKAIVGNLEPFGVPPRDVKIILIEVSAESVRMRSGVAACDLDIGYAIKV